MAKAFGFSDDELKLLLVAVRHMRRTFAKAEQATPEARAAVGDYAAFYDELFEKLREMVGLMLDAVDDVIERTRHWRQSLLHR